MLSKAGNRETCEERNTKTLLIHSPELTSLRRSDFLMFTPVYCFCRTDDYKADDFLV